MATLAQYQLDVQIDNLVGSEVAHPFSSRYVTDSNEMVQANV